MSTGKRTGIEHWQKCKCGERECPGHIGLRSVHIENGYYTADDSRIPSTEGKGLYGLPSRSYRQIPRFAPAPAPSALAFPAADLG